MKVDKSKSKGNYSYGQEVQVLFSGNVRKYKRNNGDLMQNVEVVVQNDEKSQTFYLIVRLSATKNPIFTGYLLEGKSEVRILNNKPENIEVSAFVLSKGKKAEMNRVKLQIDTADNGKELFDVIDDIIKGNLKSQEKSKSTEEKEGSQEKEAEKEQAKESKQ